MKTVKEVLLNRRSYRNYNGQNIDKKIIDDVIKVAQRSATSMNGQQISVVVIDDKEVFKQIAEVNWNQQHIIDCEYFIVFIVDYNRPGAELGDELELKNHIESVMVGGIDAGIMAQSVELLLQEEEIGTCMIGGIRNNMLRIKELLNITGNAYPVLGMTVGKVNTFENDDNLLRPRVSFDSFAFNNKYDEDAVKKGAIAYNDELNKWWEERDMQGHRGYLESMNNTYSKNYIRDEFKQLKELNFLKNYEENKKD